MSGAARAQLLATGAAVATAGLAALSASDDLLAVAAMAGAVHLVATVVATLRPDATGGPVVTGVALAWVVLLDAGLVAGGVAVALVVTTTELLGAAHHPTCRVARPSGVGLGPAARSISVGAGVTVAAALAVALPVPGGLAATIVAGAAGALAVRSLVTSSP